MNTPDATYIAGPMSPASFGLDHTPEGWDWNFPAFHAAAAQYRALGHKVINPAELDEAAGDVGEHTWDVYLRRDIRVLADCHTIVLLPHWQCSKGARLEHHIAYELGMNRIYTPGAEPK